MSRLPLCDEDNDIIGIFLKAKFQSHHSWMLDGTHEDINSKMKLMGCSFLAFDRVSCVLTFKVGGPAIRNFFLALEKEHKPINLKQVLSYQHFWGKNFVKEAMVKAKTDDYELAKKFDATELTVKRDTGLDQVSRNFMAKLSAQERKVGSISTSTILAPAQHKEMAHQHLQNERAILESIVRDRESRLVEVAAQWDRIIAMRGEFEADKKRKKESAHHMIEEGKRRKAAKIVASETMAADALNHASAMAEALTTAPAIQATQPALVSPGGEKNLADADAILGGDDF